MEELTDRDILILYWRIAGFSPKDTGEMLGISPHTVTDYTKKAYRKLEVSNLVEAFNEGLKREYWYPEDFKFEHLQDRE